MNWRNIEINLVRFGDQLKLNQTSSLEDWKNCENHILSLLVGLVSTLQSVINQLIYLVNNTMSIIHILKQSRIVEPIEIGSPEPSAISYFCNFGPFLVLNDSF